MLDLIKCTDDLPQPAAIYQYAYIVLPDGFKNHILVTLSRLVSAAAVAWAVSLLQEASLADRGILGGGGGSVPKLVTLFMFCLLF